MAHHGSFLTKLARDKRGNTIAIMAAALIPMLGLAGSAVDMSRLYVVKVRLQQACDAGVLAGRKFMTGNTATLDAAAVIQANTFFANNFQNGWMRTSATSFTPVRTSNSQVSGTASTVVPMTIMKFFDFGSRPLTVACQARFDVPDIDVMFVLDTTGSMACLPSDSDATCGAYAGSATKVSYSRPSSSNQSLPQSSNGVAGYAGAGGFWTTEKSGSRIAALRSAVLSFYDTLESVRDPNTQIRYGFVTYSSSVNAGRAIQDVIPNTLVGSVSGDTARYQSRAISADYTISTADVQNTKAKDACNAFVPVRAPLAALTYNSSNGTATRTTNVWDSSALKCSTRTETLGPRYRYDSIGWDVSSLVAGNVVTNPTKVRGQTMRWTGCVETTVDSPGQNSYSTYSPPRELDPDIVPTGASRWIPQLPDLTYVRNGSWTNTATDYTDGDEGYYVNINGQNVWVSLMYGSDAYATALNGTTRVSSDADYLQKSGAIACGKPVKRLGAMSRTDVFNFVNATDFVPMGGTYHDTGMIWGTRLISPTGPWAADTAAPADRNPPNRIIVFLTDGDMAPSSSSYSMYGMEGYDRRVTGSSLTGDPSAGRNADGTCTNTSANCFAYTTFHNNRFLAECAAAKARNIDVWTVSIDTAVSTPLQQCATTNAQALNTTTGGGLSTIFANIAKKLAMLRLVQI